MDGRIARMMNGQSRFGAELDSLSDVIAFGVSPAIILYLWALQEVPRYGWIFALAHAVCAALRLARFHANIDVADQPHKSARSVERLVGNACVRTFSSRCSPFP